MKALRLVYSAVCLAVLYFGLRVLFVWKNPSTLGVAAGDPWPDALNKVSSLFIAGLQFDLSGAALLNIPFAVAALWAAWVGASVRQRKVLFSGYLLVNVMFFTVNLADVFYFPFVGKRSSLGVLDMGGDLSDQWMQLVLQYWFVLPLLILLSSCFFLLERGWRFIEPRILASEPLAEAPRMAVRLAVTGFVLLIYFAAARGSLGTKPLGVSSAYAQVSSLQAPAALNTTFTILKVLIDEPVPSPKYLEPEQAEQLLMERSQQSPWTETGFGLLRRHNVVILILESFAREYMGDDQDRPCYMPFICELARSSVYFNWAFANGRRSIDSFYSIHAGIPALQEQALVTSSYGANRMPGLPRSLSTQGYATAFFHGGRNGTMFFDLMAKAVGFDQYFGLNEFDGSASDTDGTWGAFDEPFFAYARKKLSNLPKPFFASIFSLTSHNPYRIPSAAQGRFPKGTLPIHESIGYADSAVRSFFEAARSEPWFDQTLFVITADHTSLSDDPAYNSGPGLFRVPLLFVDGAGLLKSQRIDWPVAAQHVDVMPTVLHLLGVGSAPGRFGETVVPSARVHPIVNRTGGGYWILHGDRYAEVVGNTVKERRIVRPDLLGGVEGEFADARSAADLDLVLLEPLSMIQVFFQDLIQNRLDQPP
jgi:phosphoglycerol transferase MdoB-like AlkP superfamily enzyme